MAMFGKKKKKAAPEGADESTQETPAEPTVVSGATATSPKKRRPATMLSSVVNETVPEAGIDLLKQNAPFALPNDGGWLGLLLCTDVIGGLSQKQKGDAAKGSIIELIRANKIQVVATKDMLDNEFLGFIPNEETLGRMDEYSLLVSAPYNWVHFSVDDNGALKADSVRHPETDEVIAAKFHDAVEVARGNRSLGDVLPLHARQWGMDSAETPVVPTPEPYVEPDRSNIPEFLESDDPMSSTVGGEVFDDEGAIDYSQLDDSDHGYDEPEEAFDPIDSVPEFDDEEGGFESSWQQDEIDTADAGEPAVSGQDPSYHEYVEANRDRVVDETEVRDTIARRFLSTDLDLMVDLEEFNRTFNANAPAIQLSTAGATDWLSAHVAQLVQQGNAELELLHRQNADELREVFVETMALHVEKTMSVVSTETPGTQYHELMQGAKAEFDRERAEIADLAIVRRREITERFEKAAEARAEQAAAHARAAYRDKNAAKLESDLADVEPTLLRLQEEQFAHNRQLILDIRKKDAAVHMDVGTNRIFEHLREMRVEQHETERQLLERWNETVLRFIDENRKHDIARAEALAEELSRSDQVEQLRRKHVVEVEELVRDRDEREERLRQEIARNREEAVEQLKARNLEWQNSIDLEKERTRSSEVLRENLTLQLENMHLAYEEQYEGKLRAQEEQKQLLLREQKEARKAQRRLTRAMYVIIPTLTLAGIGVGWTIGWGLGVGG